MKTQDINTASHDLKKVHIGQQLRNFCNYGHDYIVTAKRHNSVDLHRITFRNGKRQIGKSFLKVQIGTFLYTITGHRSYGMGMFKASLDNHGAIA